jgi:hypothetical protein
MPPRLLAWTGLLLLPSASVAHGQVIQLPTFRSFSVQTSVLAPDSGGAYLGGVRRASSRNTSYGLPGGGRLFGNRSFEHSAGASLTSVHATVIDHEALDRAVLAEAARLRPARRPHEVQADAVAQKMEAASRDSSAAEAPLVSVAETRRQNAARHAAGRAEVANLIAQGDKAEANGQFGTARIYYQMARKRAGDSLQPQIAARLAALPRRAR